MFRELFEQIRDLSVKAYSPRIHRVEGDPRHCFGVEDRQGNITWKQTQPQPREHRALSLQAIVERLRGYDDWETDDGVESLEPCIWYSRQGVTLLLDDNTRRDRITLHLEFSKQLQKLQQMEASPPDLDQLSTILLLRTVFARCEGVPELVKALREVRFRSEADGLMAVQHGKSSVGQRAMAELTGTTALPEYLSLSVPIFNNAFRDIEGSVELALEPLPEARKFRLVPLPGQIEQAIASAEKDIGTRLEVELGDVEAGTVPQYYGIV